MSPRIFLVQFQACICSIGGYGSGHEAPPDEVGSTCISQFLTQMKHALSASRVVHPGLAEGVDGSQTH